jgi:hypothetical protein
VRVDRDLDIGWARRRANNADTAPPKSNKEGLAMWRVFAGGVLATVAVILIGDYLVLRSWQATASRTLPPAAERDWQRVTN